MATFLPKLSPEHGWLLLSATGMAFYQLLVGGMYVGGARRAAFGKDSEFFKSEARKDLVKAHEKEVPGAKFDDNGYPDMGNGRYAAALSYKQWLALNNAQRVHYNLVENGAGLLAVQLAAGVYFPRASAAIFLVWLVGRETWNRNYVSSGASTRYAGIGFLHQVATLSWMALAIAGGLKMTGVITTSWY